MATPDTQRAGPLDVQRTPGPPAVRALLVGIDSYLDPSLTTLRGCSNDVRAARDVLVDRLGIAPDDVLVLTDEEATRDAIEAAFRSHLIAAGQRWVADGHPDPAPAFLFYFSGHGSQAEDLTGTEPDGLDETIVPHDARGDGSADIRDYELGTWLEHLPGANVTVVLDCCHSGSGTRDPVTEDLVRAAPADKRPLQPPRPPDLGPTPGITLGVSDRHVLLAACAPHQTAFEHRRSDGTRHGLFSQALLPALARLTSTSDLTYREVLDDARRGVTRWRPRQTPWGEGDLDRVVLGTAHHRLRALATVVAAQRDVVVLDVGEVHGVVPGARFTVEIPDMDATVVEVVGADATTCDARLVDGALATGRLPREGARALLLRPELGPGRWRIAGDEDAVDVLATAARDDGPLAGLVDVVTDATASWELWLGREEDVWTVSDAHGALVSADETDAIVAAVGHLVIVGAALTRTGPANVAGDAGGQRGSDGGRSDGRRTDGDGSSPDRPGGACVSMRLRTVDVDPATGEPVPTDPPTGGVRHGRRVAFELCNDTDQVLYPSLLLFGRRWDVQVLYPSVAGDVQRWTPGTTFVVGGGRETLEATLADDEDEGRDFARLVVTSEPTSFAACELAAPPAAWSPLRPVRRIGTGPMRPDASREVGGGGPGDEATTTASTPVPGAWASATIEVITTRGPGTELAEGPS
jgi:uncharacterized caspase-like protein